jgi:carbon-monoxide dehydrogenase medium subunit
LKAAPFAYVKAAALDQVLDLLVRHGDEARLLAGGQSLIPSLNLRLAAPALLIDINGLDELAGIAVADGTLRIGALTRHRTIEQSGEIARHAPLLAQAMPYVAHPAIRNRGTLGGSIALADPAAELPACALALGARIELRGPAGPRAVAASAFFRGLYETDLRPDEVVTAISIPTPGPGRRSAFAELARRHGDYALAGLAATARVDGGTLHDLRLVFFGIGSRPTLAATAGAVLESGAGDLPAALAADLAPLADLQAGAATKLHLAGVLTARVVAQLTGARH